MTTDELLDMIVQEHGPTLRIAKLDNEWRASLRGEGVDLDKPGHATVRDALLSVLTIVHDKACRSVWQMETEIARLEGEVGRMRAVLDATRKTVERSSSYKLNTPETVEMESRVRTLASDLDLPELLDVVTFPGGETT